MGFCQDAEINGPDAPRNTHCTQASLLTDRTHIQPIFPFICSGTSTWSILSRQKYTELLRCTNTCGRLTLLLFSSLVPNPYTIQKAWKENCMIQLHVLLLMLWMYNFSRKSGCFAYPALWILSRMPQFLWYYCWTRVNSLLHCVIYCPTYVPLDFCIFPE